MFKVILLTIALSLSSVALANVQVRFDHDADFFRAEVIQTTKISETNDLLDFFEALNLHEEYRETVVVKHYTSKDKNFFFMCERLSHAQDEMVATCSFRIKKSNSPLISVTGAKDFEVWTLNKELAKEINPLLPSGGTVVIVVNRKFTVAAFSDLIAFNFTL